DRQGPHIPEFAHAKPACRCDSSLEEPTRTLPNSEISVRDYRRHHAFQLTSEPANSGYHAPEVQPHGVPSQPPSDGKDGSSDYGHHRNFQDARQGRRPCPAQSIALPPNQVTDAPGSFLQVKATARHLDDPLSTIR